MKKCNIEYIRVTIFVLTVYTCGPVIAYLEYMYIINLEILTFLMLFSEVLERMLIIKYFVG